MKKVTAILVSGHFIGACITYFYFYIVFSSGQQEAQVPFSYEIGAFMAGSGMLALSFFSLKRSNVALLGKIASGRSRISDLDEETARFAKQEALRLPAVAGLISFGVWLAAGGLFGFIEPLIEARIFGLDPPTLVLSLRRFFGIAFLGGGVTCLLVFFLVDMVWRTYLPLFFPEGRLDISYGFRMGLKTRFIMIFSGMILIPMPVVGMILVSNVRQMNTADALTRAALTRSMYWEFAFVSMDFLLISVILAYLLSRSIISPLKEIQKTVLAVKHNDLNQRVPVRCNDELGDVVQGVNAMAEGLEQGARARDSLGRYMCREIRDQVLSQAPELSGEMKRVTLLFSDLRNFTGMVEDRHPEEVVRIINDYFEEMTRAVRDHKGLILQYVGDEIEAVFGAPVGFEDHPEMAVKAALAMRQGLEELNRRFAAEGLPQLSHGIGIHSGAVLAGNIGSEERMSYALVGDTVNTASRIEGLTKTHDTDIIVSQTTLSLLTGQYRTEPLGPVRVKGKHQEIIVHKLIS